MTHDGRIAAIVALAYIQVPEMEVTRASCLEFLSNFEGSNGEIFSETSGQHGHVPAMHKGTRTFTSSAPVSCHASRLGFYESQASPQINNIASTCSYNITSRLLFDEELQKNEDHIFL